MAQIILDEQLNRDRVLKPLLQWVTTQKLEELHPNEVIKDDRIPSILRELKQPTFVTIDVGFWNRSLLDPHYSILYFSFQDNQQPQLPSMLRRLFRIQEFKTKSIRMGKIAKISTTSVEYWQWGDFKKHRFLWLPQNTLR